MFPDAEQLKMPGPGVSSAVIQVAPRTEETARSDATLYKKPLLRKTRPLELFLVVHYVSPRSEISAFGFLFTVSVSLTICGL